MVNLPVNATGWSDLMDGHIVTAVYNMYNTAFGSMGIPVVILFFVYQIMLYSKTQNVTLMWVTGIIFAGLYVTSSYVEVFSVQIIFFLLLAELVGILFLIFFKKS